MCDCEEQNFTATATGSDYQRMLTVEGYCTCSQSGNRLFLELDNPGINPDPTMLVLRLMIEEPEISNPVITKTKVEPFRTDIAPEVTSVLIRQPEGPDLMIPVVDRVKATTR